MKHSNEGPYVLALDHGTSGCKTALVSARGKIVDFEFAPTGITFLPGGGAEQDPEEWWRAFMKAAKKLIGRGKVRRTDIAAIAVSSTFSSTVAVDRDGRHLMNSLTWMDSRGEGIIREIAGGLVNIEGYGITNLYRWIHKTGGGPSLSGKDDIAHLLYVKRHHPDIYEKTWKFIGSKDYFNLRLTGECVSSFDAMTLFWVSDIRDINDIRYDDALIKKFGFDAEKLPAMRRSIDFAGTLLPGVAKELGLPPSVKVVMGGPDHQCALVGSGAVNDFQGHLYIGTSSWIECLVPFKKTDLFHSIASLPSSVPGRYQCINEQDVAGGALSFLKENILFHRNLLRKRSTVKDPYLEMDKIAESVPAGSNRLIMAPWLNGERSPVDSTTLRAGIFNISMTTTVDHLIRACYEGVAYNTRWSLKYVEKFIGRKFENLSMIGGGAKSATWCRIFADVMDRTILQVEDPMQANARGAAFLALVGMGEIGFDDIPGLVRHTASFEPDPKNRAIYDELFGEFVNIYRNNRAMYGRLNRGNRK
ncbi:MAG TPA: FGGY-family carbohydrate kinase [Spirochaetota bacterium]|nr:FGGY-family carbohydrate kinase [Spirochaetota bacterium]